MAFERMYISPVVVVVSATGDRGEELADGADLFASARGRVVCQLAQVCGSIKQSGTEGFLPGRGHRAIRVRPAEFGHDRLQRSRSANVMTIVALPIHLLCSL